MTKAYYHIMSDINSLLKDSPFESSTLLALESYLRLQLSGKTSYHYEANQYLMKNYQIHTKMINVDLIEQILILSLMKLPNTDFLAISYLVPITASLQPNIQHIMKCSMCLEKGKFKEFWIEFSQSPNGLFNAAVGFVGAIRSFILQMLANTFKNIPLALFLEQLGLPVEEISAFIAASPKSIEVCPF